MQIDHSGGRSSDDSRNGEHDDGKEDIREQTGDGCGNVIEHIDGPVKSDTRTPGNRQAAQGIDEYVLEGLRGDVQLLPQLAIDEVVEENSYG